VDYNSSIISPECEGYKTSEPQKQRSRIRNKYKNRVINRVGNKVSTKVVRRVENKADTVVGGAMDYR